MEIKVLELGEIGVNCYLIAGDNSVVVIDPGFESEVVTNFLKKNSHKDRMIILTHSHFDHISAAEKLRTDTDTKIAIGVFDNPALSDVKLNLSYLFGVNLSHFSADILLYDGDLFKVGDLEFKVIHTPGHTVGGISLLIDDILISGDTLFYQSIGRTDFPGGDFKTLLDSLEKLFLLDGEITVLPGHGIQTTIKHEREYNPYRKKI